MHPICLGLYALNPKSNSHKFYTRQKKVPMAEPLQHTNESVDLINSVTPKGNYMGKYIGNYIGNSFGWFKIWLVQNMAGSEYGWFKTWLVQKIAFNPMGPYGPMGPGPGSMWPNTNQ